MEIQNNLLYYKTAKIHCSVSQELEKYFKKFKIFVI